MGLNVKIRTHDHGPTTIHPSQTLHLCTPFSVSTYLRSLPTFSTYMPTFSTYMPNFSLYLPTSLPIFSLNLPTYLQSLPITVLNKKTDKFESEGETLDEGGVIGLPEISVSIRRENYFGETLKRVWTSTAGLTFTSGRVEAVRKYHSLVLRLWLWLRKW